jgi:hypothetical protein
MQVDRRGCLGAVYRITFDFLRERSLVDGLKEKLSPASLRVLEKPPFPFSWQDAAPLEEIERILYAQSPELAADLGFAAAKFLSGNIVAPVFKMAMALFGGTPDTIFSHLDRFFSMVVRGFTFRYERDGAKEGRVVAVIAGGEVHPAVFQQLKGNLAMMYGICGARGTVAEPKVLRSDETGAEISLGVRWD